MGGAEVSGPVLVVLSYDISSSADYSASLHVPASTLALFANGELDSVFDVHNCSNCTIGGHAGACLVITLTAQTPISLVTLLLKVLRPSASTRRPAAEYFGFSCHNRSSSIKQRKDSAVYSSILGLAEHISNDCPSVMVRASSVLD